MSDEIIRSGDGLHDWFGTPPGQYLLDWERRQFGELLSDVFGYRALQLGLADLDALENNRMSSRWLALEHWPAEPVQRHALCMDFRALPFAEGSLDLVVLPHTLELSSDPHQVLREVERVLMPEGRLVVTGLNPASLWGLREQRSALFRRVGLGRSFLPRGSDPIGYWRLRDWLRLLGLEPSATRFGAYRPAVRTSRWLDRWAWMDRAGGRWWPVFGAVYLLMAVKRVHGMRLLSQPWAQQTRIAGAPMPAAHRGPAHRTRGPREQSEP